MTPTLEEVRAELVADLTAAGFAVTETVDAQILAPAVLVTAADDFIGEGDLVGEPDEVVVRLDLFLLPEVAERDAFIDALTGGIQRLILAVDDCWSFRGASGPFKATNLGGQIACRVRLTTTARLTTT